MLPVSKDNVGGYERADVSRPMGIARVCLKAIAADMMERHLGQAETLGGRVALYLDPRTKSSGPKVCIDGVEATKERPVEKLKRQAANMVNITKPTSYYPENPSSDSSGVAPLAKKARSRLEQLKGEGKSSEADG